MDHNTEAAERFDAMLSRLSQSIERLDDPGQGSPSSTTLNSELHQYLSGRDDGARQANQDGPESQFRGMLAVLDTVTEASRG